MRNKFYQPSPKVHIRIGLLHPLIPEIKGNTLTQKLFRNGVQTLMHASEHFYVIFAQNIKTI